MHTLSSFAQTVLLSASNLEPTLDDMLADPITRLLMSSDRVRPMGIQRILAAARNNRN